MIRGTLRLISGIVALMMMPIILLLSLPIGIAAFFIMKAAVPMIANMIGLQAAVAEIN